MKSQDEVWAVLLEDFAPAASDKSMRSIPLGDFLCQEAYVSEDCVLTAARKLVNLEGVLCFPSAAGCADGKGSAVAVLASLRRIAEQQPEALVVVAPSLVPQPLGGVLTPTQGRGLQAALAAAIRRVRRQPEDVLLLAVSPLCPLTGVDWVVPVMGARGTRSRAPREATCYVASPPLRVAERLYAEGGACSTSILVASVERLLALYATYLPDLWHEPGVRHFGGRTMIHADFETDLLEVCCDELSLLDLEAFGWTWRESRGELPLARVHSFAAALPEAAIPETTTWLPPASLGAVPANVLQFVAR